MVDIFDWPLLFYCLKFFQNLGIRDIMLVTNPEHVGSIGERIGSGVIKKRGCEEILFDMNFTFRTQREAGGIAQAIALAEDFVREGERLVVLLGDNVIEGNVCSDFEDYLAQPSGAKVFLKKVPDPERFGVPRFENGHIVEIIEKPGHAQLNPGIKPPSSFAVVGIYMYDHTAFDRIRRLVPSARGELEVTDLNRSYLGDGELTHGVLEGWWSDVGDPYSLLDTAALVRHTGANNKHELS
jgi:glucose-1-phosphate thymidylyltransferase